ncbi:MAG: hypothetical protein KJT03_05700, partial [Verrucomicrobiae bacterium]|nr:hypothetical protein [Verrucomicrobiae bacterium]
VRLFGYGGNAAPSPGNPLIRLMDCRDILLGNINPQMWGIGHWGALGIHYHPKDWFILEDDTFKINGLSQFAYYRLP